MKQIFIPMSVIFLRGLIPLTLSSERIDSTYSLNPLILESNEGFTEIIILYLAHIFKDIFLKQYSTNSGIQVESLQGTNIERYSLNIFSMAAIIFATLIFFLTSLVIPGNFVFWQTGMQNMAMLSGAFVLLYNGKRGYNAKWFRVTSYLYYPLHLLIIFGIGILI